MRSLSRKWIVLLAGTWLMALLSAHVLHSYAHSIEKTDDVATCIVCQLNLNPTIAVPEPDQSAILPLTRPVGETIGFEIHPSFHRDEITPHRSPRAPPFV